MEGQRVIDFKGQVAIVTGAGNGLGRSHALALASRGARLVVNDLAGPDGTSLAAESVADEIRDAGGEAFAHGADVSDMDQVQDMVEHAMDRWKQVDILVNNAGILRDKSFGKSSLTDFRLVLDVHLMGSVNCSKAVWDIMKAQNYGRIAMTTSTSGIYGNFGQTNYGAAKMGVLGLMNVLSHEGFKNNIRVNALSPAAGTQMTEHLLSEEMYSFLKPETVTPGLLFLVSEHAPSRAILSAGGGGYSMTKIVETEGIWLPDEEQSPESVSANWHAITDPAGERWPDSGSDILQHFVEKARSALGRVPS